jgi:hypothetical protein
VPVAVVVHCANAAELVEIAIATAKLAIIRLLRALAMPMPQL